MNGGVAHDGQRDGRAADERVRHAAEHRARERAHATGADDEQIGAERRRGRRDAVDDIAVGGVRRRRQAALRGPAVLRLRRCARGRRFPRPRGSPGRRRRDRPGVAAGPTAPRATRRSPWRDRSRTRAPGSRDRCHRWRSGWSSCRPPLVVLEPTLAVQAQDPAVPCACHRGGVLNAPAAFPNGLRGRAGRGLRCCERFRVTGRRFRRCAARARSARGRRAS